VKTGLQFYIEFGRFELDKGCVGRAENMIDSIYRQERLNAFRYLLLDYNFENRVDAASRRVACPAKPLHAARRRVYGVREGFSCVIGCATAHEGLLRKKVSGCKLQVTG